MIIIPFVAPTFISPADIIFPSQFSRQISRNFFLNLLARQTDFLSFSYSNRSNRREEKEERIDNKRCLSGWDTKLVRHEGINVHRIEKRGGYFRKFT